MKEKTKKLLAGIGLGICSALTLTACTSDITFNQSDLDNVISGANQYLETQNNYSSEFAKNMLNDFLMKSLYDSQNTTSGTFNSSYKAVDEFGNLIREGCATNKYYLDADSNKTKQSYLGKDLNGNIKYNGYREIIYNANASNLDELYKVKTYDLLAETYTDSCYSSSSDIGAIHLDHHTITGMATISENIMYVLNYLNLYELVGDITMETISENEYMFYFISDMNVSKDLIYRQNMSVRIKDGRLVSWEAILTGVECQTIEDEFVVYNEQSNMGMQYTKMEIEWGTADFTVDTSDCVLVTE